MYDRSSSTLPDDGDALWTDTQHRGEGDHGMSQLGAGAGAEPSRTLGPLLRFSRGSLFPACIPHISSLSHYPSPIRRTLFFCDFYVPDECECEECDEVIGGQLHVPHLLGPTHHPTKVALHTAEQALRHG